MAAKHPRVGLNHVTVVPTTCRTERSPAENDERRVDSPFETEWDAPRRDPDDPDDSDDLYELDST